MECTIRATVVVVEDDHHYYSDASVCVWDWEPFFFFYFFIQLSRVERNELSANVSLTVWYLIDFSLPESKSDDDATSLLGVWWQTLESWGEISIAGSSGAK